MTGLTAQNRSLVFAEVQKQPYAARCGKEEIDQALGSAVDIFSDYEQTVSSGLCAVVLRSAGGQRATDFARELIPGLVYAHRFFGDSLPKGLKEKLRNQSQTHDTLLELWCSTRSWRLSVKPTRQSLLMSRPVCVCPMKVAWCYWIIIKTNPSW